MTTESEIPQEPAAILSAFYGPNGPEVSVGVRRPSDFPIVGDRVTQYPLYAHPPAPAVKVRELVWREINRRVSYGVTVAASSSGATFYELMLGSQGLFEVYSNGVPTCTVLPTIDEAKAAAQADYEARIRAALVEDAPHPDDISVDRFAAALKAKLAKKRAEGYGGWDDKEACSNVHLSQLLVEHVRKGDPVDIGNLAMMLHQRGELVADDRERYVAAVESRRQQEGS